MSYESRVEKFRALAGQTGAQANEAILNAAQAQGYAGQDVNGALRYLALAAGGGTQDDINDAMHAAATAAGKAGWGDVDGADLSFSADWSGYDGSNNGTAVDLLAQDHRGGWACGIDDTRVLAVQSEGPNGSSNFVARIITRDGTTPSLGAALNLEAPAGTVIGTNPYCVRMSAVRYMVTCRIFNGSAWTGRLWLLGLSGDTLSILASADYADTPDLVFGLTRHSDTLAVFAYQEAVSNRPNLVAVNIAGDAIAQGTPVEADTGSNAGSCSPAGLSAATGHFASASDVIRYTVAGTVITMGNSVSVPNMTNKPKRNVRIDATHSLLMFVDPSGGFGNYDLKSVIVSDAATPTLGSVLTIESGQNFPNITLFNLEAANNDATQFVTTWNINNSYAKSTALLVDPDASYALTKTANVIISEVGATPEHPTAASFGTSGYACSFWQDEADSQAMGTIVFAS